MRQIDDLLHHLREIEMTGAHEYSAKTLLLIYHYLTKVEIMDMSIFSRIEIAVTRKIVSLSTEEVVLLLVTHSRMMWKLNEKMRGEETRNKQRIVSHSKNKRVLVQQFWDEILPLVSPRIYEFHLEQLVDILQAACKPFVGKRSVVRILLGFFHQSVDLLEKLSVEDPRFGKAYDRLIVVIPVLFEKQMTRGEAENKLKECLQKKFTSTRDKPLNN